MLAYTIEINRGLKYTYTYYKTDEHVRSRFDFWP
jgi:hypothetical protein